MTYVCDECDQDMVEIRRVDYEDGVFARGRVIWLHDISVYRCPCGDTPIFPSMYKLTRLLNADPALKDFYWDEASGEWSAGPSHAEMEEQCQGNQSR